jgi:DNA-directed RNA polymerase specialized sigma24 family protein
MTDQEILDRIKKGDEAALDFLYKKNYKMMVNMIIKNNGTEDEAKDIYQEALLAFWIKAASGKL